MEAGLSDKQVAAILEPGQHPAGKAADFVVAEIHEEPIGKDDVVFVGRQFQFRHVRTYKVHVSVMTVALLVPANIVGHKVHRRELLDMPGQVLREPPAMTHKICTKKGKFPIESLCFCVKHCSRPIIKGGS